MSLNKTFPSFLPFILAWVYKGPVTMVCQAMWAGGTEGVLSVERFCTARVGLTWLCPRFLLLFFWTIRRLQRKARETSQLYLTTARDKSYRPVWERDRERNVLFNDALNTFYLRLYGARHMVKDHSDSEKGNPLLPHRLLLSINSKGSFICTIPQTG